MAQDLAYLKRWRYDRDRVAAGHLRPARGGVVMDLLELLTEHYEVERWTALGSPSTTRTAPEWSAPAGTPHPSIAGKPTSTCTPRTIKEVPR